MLFTILFRLPIKQWCKIRNFVMQNLQESLGLSGGNLTGQKSKNFIKRR